MKNVLIGIPAVALALTVGGFVAANSQKQTAGKSQQAPPEAAYVCPLTGEELPCPACCPLNERK